MAIQEKAIRVARLMFTISALSLGVFAPGPSLAGGLILYEIGTADVGLGSAGYNARAQDASTVFTNPAGMTRLEGTQFLGAGQIDYGRAKFSIGSGTSSALGTDNGGNAFGSDGWFPGGGAFFSYSASQALKLGFAMTGNFGVPLQYDDNWAGRYYVQEATMLGLSLLPSIAYKVTNKFSVGASMTAMYGKYKNQVAINIPDAQCGLAAVVQVRPGGARHQQHNESYKPYDKPGLQGHLALCIGRAVPGERPVAGQLRCRLRLGHAKQLKCLAAASRGLGLALWRGCPEPV
jgi:long-subunit fatty acid transport protein